jgi:hypothetical protein
MIGTFVPAGLVSHMLEEGVEAFGRLVEGEVGNVKTLLLPNGKPDDGAGVH